MSLEAAPSGAQAVAAALRQPDPFRFNGRCLLKADQTLISTKRYARAAGVTTRCTTSILGTGGAGSRRSSGKDYLRRLRRSRVQIARNRIRSPGTRR
jgi:hypothetical protein